MPKKTVKKVNSKSSKSSASKKVTKKSKVSREENIQKRIAKDKARVLKALSDSLGIVMDACKKAKITTPTFYEWKRLDKDFLKEIEKIQDSFNEFVDDTIKKKVKDGDGHMLRFYAGRRIPEYRRKQENTLVNPDDFNFDFTVEVVKSKKDKK
jgi:hypothetical protein